MQRATTSSEPCSIGVEDLRRLRWRARRGLLENDLILGRFFARYEQSLNASQWKALQDLLELDDNILLDLMLGHADLPLNHRSAEHESVLHMLRTA